MCAYSRAWTDTTPIGTDPAKNAPLDMQHIRVDLRERLQSIFTMNNFTDDPLKVSRLSLGYAISTFGGNTQYIDDTGLAKWQVGFRSTAAAKQFVIYDIANTADRLQIDATTGRLTIPAGGLTVTLGGFTISAGGLIVVAGGATIAGTTVINGTINASSSVNLTADAAQLTTTTAGVTTSRFYTDTGGGIIAVDGNHPFRIITNGVDRFSVSGLGAVLVAGTLTTNSDFNINNGAARNYIIRSNGAGELAFIDNTAVSTRWKIDASGNLLPEASNTYALGATGNRPSTIYTVALNASGIITATGNNRALGTGSSAAAAAAWRFGDTNSASSRDWTISNGIGGTGTAIGQLTFSISAGLSGDPLTAGTTILTLTSSQVITAVALNTTQLQLSTAASRIIPGATSLTIRNAADSADNFVITNAGAISIPGTLAVTGTITGSVTGNVTGNLIGNVTGNVTGVLTLALGSAVAGTIFKTAANGTTIQGAGGSSNELIITNSTNTLVAYVPNGTNNIGFSGNVTIGGSLAGITATFSSTLASGTHTITGNLVASGAVTADHATLTASLILNGNVTIGSGYLLLTGGFAAPIVTLVDGMLWTDAFGQLRYRTGGVSKTVTVT